MDILLSFLPQEFFSSTGMLISALTLIFYLAESFLGYKLTRSSISLIGFLFGAVIGFQLVYGVTGHSGYALVGAIACAVICSVFAYKVSLVGIFLVAAFGVFHLSLTYLPLEGESLLLVSLVLAVVAAYLATKYMRPAIIIITAFHGGMMAATLLPSFIAIPADLTSFTLGITVSALGAAAQFLTTKK